MNRTHSIQKDLSLHNSKLVCIWEEARHWFFSYSEYKIPVYQSEGPSDKQKIELCCDAANATTVKDYEVFLWLSILYFTPENADASFSKCASSSIQILIFKPCFGKCILCGSSVIDYTLLSAIIVYTMPQSSTGWKHRQWCQCWSDLIGHLKTKGICFQRLVRLVLEVTSWCFSPCVGRQLPGLRVPFHSGPPP